MSLSLSMHSAHELKPKITVVGVGGAGGNAVNNMITSGLGGVDFVACNTDAQALGHCLTERKIQLGNTITHGLGAGARPEIGRAAAEEALDEILDQLQGSNMVFITAGMGGGTGTGAAPVIARAVREQGILTVGVVTKPFHFEGAHRMRLAEGGLTELQQYVDTLIVIPNQNLFRLANERTTFGEAFQLADQVLHMGVRGVTDLMVMPGLINLDFADIRTVMSEMGKAMMGTGEAEGERRAIDAAEAAISNPLLDEVSMRGARGVLINITGGTDMTLFEVDAAANRIKEEVDGDANIIFGSTFDETLNGQMRVSVVATGIENAERRAAAEEAQAAAQQQGHGWFPSRVQQAQPMPGPARRAQPEASPAAGLRAAAPRPAPQEEPAPYAEPERAQAYELAEAPAEAMPVKSLNPVGRGPEHGINNLLKRVRGLNFQRGGAPEQRRAPATRPYEGEAGARPARDEIGEIPAFLRRKDQIDG
ncbi:MAG: cell division protein FtsZ [Geminicoccaceae bacterium]|nr:cell division protein FtsZ [Geminicoccaceae bacterium]